MRKAVPECLRKAGRFSTGIVGLDHSFQCSSGNHLVHLVEEHLAAGFLALGILLCAGEAQRVGHRWAPRITVPTVAYGVATVMPCSENP